VLHQHRNRATTTAKLTTTPSRNDGHNNIVRLTTYKLLEQPPPPDPDADADAHAAVGAEQRRSRRVEREWEWEWK